MKKNIIIIGGGASGLMCAISAAENCNVIVLEKNDKVAKKVMITGRAGAMLRIIAMLTLLYRQPYRTEGFVQRLFGL